MDPLRSLALALHMERPPRFRVVVVRSYWIPKWIFRGFWLACCLSQTASPEKQRLRELQEIPTYFGVLGVVLYGLISRVAMATIPVRLLVRLLITTPRCLVGNELWGLLWDYIGTTAGIHSLTPY